MTRSIRQFLFQQVYYTASLVEASLDDEDLLAELDWDDPDLRLSAVRFAKISLLHRFIYAMIAFVDRHEFRKHADLYDAERIGDIEALLDAYGVSYLPCSRFSSPIPVEQARSREEDPFHQWFLSQGTQFELLWERQTDEVFHLLFANRSFLLKFNRAIADYLRTHHDIVPSEFRSAEGGIKRQPVPVWVRDAVFYRDQGRCVLCQVDLSGLISTDRVDHLDHMVALADWGPNDPCNIQLLCEACNLRKAAGAAVTGVRYSAWWKY